MRRGLGLVAIVVGGAVVAGGIAAGTLGPAQPGTASGSARSGVWMCPHGGGEGWSGFLSLANPGAAPVEARITALEGKAPGEAQSVSVPAKGEIVVEVPTPDPSASTYVEYFGGWIAAGWVVRAGDPNVGLGTEPCLASSAATWYTTESSTQRGTRAWVVVMNPHAADAVFNVALYTPTSAPFRPQDLTDVVLKGRRSVAFKLGAQVKGEDVIGTLIDVKVGRVAVATLSVSLEGGVRSTVGATGPATTWELPTAAGAGQTTLLTFDPNDDGLTLATAVRTEGQPEGAVSSALEQLGRSTLASPVTTNGPSSIEVAGPAGPPFLAALRSVGRTDDHASTAGASAAATGWVVPPTLASQPATTVLVVANPGATEATVTLTLLPIDETDAATITITVPAGSVVPAPAEFMAEAPRSAVAVTSSVPVVPLGASTSGGKDGLLFYGLAMGVPVPVWASAG